MKRLTLFVLLLAGLVLAGCGSNGIQGLGAITDAYLRDTIFSVEPRVNGSTTMWMTHDDVGYYCTTDRALGQKILAMIKDTSQPVEVLVEYRSVNIGDPEYNGATLGGCARESTGAGSSDKGSNNANQQMYKIISITRVAVPSQAGAA